MKSEILPIKKYNDIKSYIGNGKPTILAFGMSHCYSCLTMSKVLTEVLKEHPSYQIFSLDGQKERIVLRDIYKQKMMPVQIFFDKEGDEVFRYEGAYKKPVFDIILKKYGFEED